MRTNWMSVKSKPTRENRAKMTTLPQRLPREREVVVDTAGLLQKPSPATIRGWVNMAAGDACGDVFVRFVEPTASRELNARYRGIDEPTNVLSFPSAAESILGDLAICVEVLADEAITQRKSFESHLAHLVIHGVLHLRGYDHDINANAQQMESTEISMLQELGIANPYE